MLKTSDSMQEVSGNEFLKDGCYSIHVIQSLLKSNDFSFIFLNLFFFFFFIIIFFFLELQKTAENIMDFVDLIANMTGLMSITVSNVSGSWPIQGSLSLFVFSLFSFPCVNSVYFSLIKVDVFM